MTAGLQIVGPSRRRAHDPARPQLVPPIAAGSSDPVVRQLIPKLEQLYERRHALRGELRSPMGKLLFPAFPELLARPPKKKDAEAAADFEWRRSERTEAVIRVLLVLASCCNWRTMEILDPKGGYLSVHRVAELAELPYMLVAPKDEDDRNRRFRMDAVERALRDLRAGRILCFTKQHREQKPDGTYTTTAPALRKLSVHFFTKWGDYLTKSFLWLRDEIKKRRGRNDRRERNRPPSPGTDIRIAESLEDVRRPMPSIRRASVAQVQAGPARPVPPDLLESVAADHPGWELPEMLTEARRRLRELDPPDGGADAPPEKD